MLRFFIIGKDDLGYFLREVKDIIYILLFFCSFTFKINLENMIWDIFKES